MDDAKELWAVGSGRWAVGEGGKEWFLCNASLKCSFFTSLLQGGSALSFKVYGK
jgi:hypothetical protein